METGLSDIELRSITGCWWGTKDKKRRDACQYIFGVHNGIVRTVYKPTIWRPRVQGDTNWQEDTGKKPRWGFDGKDAPEMEHCLSTSVRHLLTQQWTHRYIAPADLES